MLFQNSSVIGKEISFLWHYPVDLFMDDSDSEVSVSLRLAQAYSLWSMIFFFSKDEKYEICAYMIFSNNVCYFFEKTHEHFERKSFEKQDLANLSYISVSF
jgi:hypothetical protein